MRHLKSKRKLSREAGQRKALLKSLATALVAHKKIITTKIKAKEAVSFLEPIVTIAKKGDLASKKKIHSIFSKETSEILIKKVGPRYKNRNGGYTRITKLGPRKGDAAEMVKLEFV